MASKSNPDDLAGIMPRGLTKAEKAAFRRVCDMRSAAGKPIAAIEADMVLDYVQTRARLVGWQRSLKQGQRRDEYGSTEMYLREQLSVAAAVDRTAAACRRLARDLQLHG